MTNKLLTELARATGLPEPIIHKELNDIIAKTGKDSAHLTLDQLREIIADYLRDVIFKMKIETSGGKS